MVGAARCAGEDRYFAMIDAMMRNQQAMIADPRGELLRIARTALADFNPWALRDAGTLITASLKLSESDQRYSELGIRGQIEQINEVDIDGDYGWELTGRCVPSDAGGDEFYIEFGDDTP